MRGVVRRYAHEPVSFIVVARVIDVMVCGCYSWWCMLTLCILFIGAASSHRIASHTGLVLANRTYVELNGKEVEYLDTYVISHITEAAPYLLVEEGTIQVANLVEASYNLYKYSSDGIRNLTYQARATDERGYPTAVQKEAIFGVVFHLTFQVPPPKINVLAKDKSEQPAPEGDAPGDTPEAVTKEVEIVDAPTEIKESVTTELTIFQDMKGLFSIRSCVSYKTPVKKDSKDDSVNRETTESTESTNQEKEKEKTAPMELEIMSYNIWNYNAPWGIRTDMIADEVAAALPDIIAWQEVRYSRWEGMMHAKQVKIERWGGVRYQLEQLGNALLEKDLKYHFVFQPSMVYVHNLPDYEIEGLAYYSKHPILESNFASLSRDVENRKDEHQRICFRALINTPIGKLNVFVTHMSLDEDAQIRNAQEILKFADQYDFPQVLMGDFNCLPNATAIKFLTGQHSIDGTTGNFMDAWVDYTSSISPLCDEHNVCERPCTRTTPNATCWEEDGHTFNALDDRPRKRIDFMLVRGNVKVRDVRFVGNTPKMHDGKKVMASDHFGMTSKFLFNDKP